MDMMFEVDNSVVDSNDLLRKVRQNVLKISDEVQEEAISNGAVTTSISVEKMRQIEENLDMMLDNIQAMNRTWYHVDAPLTTRFTFIKPIVIFFKRAIRKSIYWFTQPYVEQQNAFNGAVTRAVSDSLRAQRELLESLERH